MGDGQQRTQYQGFDAHGGFDGTAHEPHSPDMLTVDLLDSLPDVLKDSEQQAPYGKARGGGADLHHILEEMNAMRRSMEAAQEAASAEREENAKFRKEFEFLKKKVDVVDAELLRIAEEEVISHIFKKYFPKRRWA